MRYDESKIGHSAAHGSTSVADEAYSGENSAPAHMSQANMHASAHQGSGDFQSEALNPERDIDASSDGKEGNSAVTSGLGINTEAKVNAEPYASGIKESGEEASELAGVLRSGENKIRNYQDMLDRMRQPESNEDRLRREKKERSKRIIGALSDGLRSLGNLYYTSQYAPDMYQGSTRQLERTNQWIEKMRAEREKEEEAYNNLTLKLADAEGELAKNVNDLKARQEARRLARKEAERKQAEHEARMNLQPYLVDKARAERDSAQVDAAYRPMMNAAKLENEGKRGAVYDSQVEKYRSAAAASNRANPYQYRAWDKNGKPHYFAKKDAAEMFAKQEGTDVWEEVQTTVTEVEGLSEKKKTTSKEQVVPGKPEKPEKKPNPMGSQEKPRGEKKANPMN